MIVAVHLSWPSTFVHTAPFVCSGGVINATCHFGFCFCFLLLVELVGAVLELFCRILRIGVLAWNRWMGPVGLGLNFLLFCLPFPETYRVLPGRVN